MDNNDYKRVTEKAAITVLETLFGRTAAAIFDVVALGAETAGVYTRPQRTFEQRLNRLDDAREALKETLDAIDEIKAEAQRNEQRQAVALQALQDTLQSHETAEQKLASIKKLMEVDVSTLREAAGIPNVGKERLIGAVSAVLCSLVAAGVWLLGETIIKRWAEIAAWGQGLLY